MYVFEELGVRIGELGGCMHRAESGSALLENPGSAAEPACGGSLLAT